MNTPTLPQTASSSSLWVENLVNDLAGLTIKAKHSLFCESSPFQKIEVFDTYSYGKILILAGTIVLTERDEAFYHEMIVHPGVVMQGAPERVCIIGAGDGGALREVLKHDCVSSVTAVEIDEQVVGAVRAHFPNLAAGFDNARTNLVIDDGLRFLDADKTTYDLIVVDSFDPGGPVQTLLSRDFYELVHRRLAPGGVAVFQTDSPLASPDVLRSTVAALSPLFPGYRPYCCAVPSFPDGLCCFLCCSHDSDALYRVEEKRLDVCDNCHYYNREVHSGAFALPQYLLRTLR